MVRVLEPVLPEPPLSSPPQAATPNDKPATRQLDAASARTRKAGPSSETRFGAGILPFSAAHATAASARALRQDEAQPARFEGMWRKAILAVAVTSMIPTVIRNASIALVPSAHRTIQITRPMVVATASPMRRDATEGPARSPLPAPAPRRPG